MANYWQFRGRHPENKLVYYICGAELALRLEVLDAVVAQYPEADRIDRDAAKCSFAEIECAVLDAASRLRVVVLHNVDALKDNYKGFITIWADAIVHGDLIKTVLIVHTGEDTPDTAMSLYRPFVEKGRYVECKPLSVEGLKKYALEYNLTDAAADLILELVSYNFLKLNNELEKLACLELAQIDEAVVRKLVVFSADDLFLNHMLNRNTEQAMKVVSAVPEQLVNNVLTALVKKLSFLHLVIINDTAGMNAHKLAAILGVQPWQLLEFFSIKRYWTAAKILESLKLIVNIESHYSRYSSNVLPLLVSWWR